MSQITFTLDDATLTLLTTSFGGVFGYQALLPDGTPNPQSINDFTKDCIVNYAKGITKEYQQAVAKQQVEDTIQSQLDSISVDVSITS